MGGKLAHVHPDLSDQDLCRFAVNARDGVEKLDLTRERGDHPLYLDAKLRDRLVAGVDVGEDLTHHEGVMGGEASFQSIPERRQLRAQLPPGQLRQYLRVGGALDEGIEHRPARDPEHASGHTRELYPGILQDLIQTLDLPGALFDQRLAVTGKVPELPDLFGGHEAGVYKSVLHELANPLGVLNVGLPTGDILEVPGVQKPTLEVVLQQVVDRLPIDTGGLHAYQLDLEGGQPVSKLEQSLGGGSELPDLLVRRATTLSGDLHARGDRRLVHVEPTAPFDYSIHLSLSLRPETSSAAGRSLFRRESGVRALRQQFGVPEAPASH